MARPGERREVVLDGGMRGGPALGDTPLLAGDVLWVRGVQRVRPAAVPAPDGSTPLHQVLRGGREPTSPRR